MSYTPQSHTVQPDFLTGSTSGFLQLPAPAVSGYFVILKQKTPTTQDLEYWLADLQVKELAGFWGFCFWWFVCLFVSLEFLLLLFLWGLLFCCCCLVWVFSVGNCVTINLFWLRRILKKIKFYPFLNIRVQTSCLLLPPIFFFFLRCQQKLEGDKFMLLQMNAEVYIYLFLNY